MHVLWNGLLGRIPISSLVLGKKSSQGIKVDTGAPTYPWGDIIGDVSPKTTGAGTPVLGTVFGGVWKGWFQAAGDLTYCHYHLPHDYALGTDLFLHLHWLHNGTAISGNLIVDYAISYAKGHNQANFITEVTPQLSVSTPNIATIPQYRHRVDEIQISASSPSATQIDTDDLEPDGLITVGVTVNTIPTITGGSTNKPCFLTLDVHYQSTGIGTKQKSPNFYS